MSAVDVYLKPNVLVEPLFNRWYAWTYLIAPATAAMFTANSHIKIMQSFIQAPQIHVAALKNPAMRGGPFIDASPDQVDEIKTLLNRTSSELACLIKFAEAVRSLDYLLDQEAKGESLERLYARIPEELSGYVELVYDLNNHPSIRFIEGLLYQSPYYNPALQSVALSLGTQVGRRYALSTPRLAKADALNIHLPFRHEAYDELFKMRREPRPIDQIREKLAIDAADEILFSTFFTDEPPAGARPYEEDVVRNRYFGHACILVETKNTSVLCDPLVSYGLKASGPSYSYDDLPRQIDYVLLTQNQPDH
jgi:hypothetical protein